MSAERGLLMTGTKATSAAPPAIHARGISKSFGGAAALSGVDLLVAAGERHAVVGENGAGKSTLMRVLAGLITPDHGSVECFGEAIMPTAGSARAAGVALVHQERSLVPQMTVAENICLGSSPTKAGFVDRRQQVRITKSLLERVGVDVGPSTRLGRLSSAQQQFVEIAKALRQDPRVLILDEPSASLTPPETERLLALLRTLSESGIAIVYISHRLPEIFALCDSATVLRDGHRVGTFELSNTSSGELVKLMVGRALEHDLRVKRQPHTGRVALRAENITSDLVRNVSFAIHAGEIVGLGGLVGAGRTELIRAVVGLDHRRGGTVTVMRADGHISMIDTYVSAASHGIGFLPEDRRSEGVLIDMSIEENLTLPTRAKSAWMGIARGRERVRQANDIIEKLNVQTTNGRAPVGSLSGGNQQKVAFGKWLPANPPILILDEPTRGVDVGAKTEIHTLIRSLADAGTAVLFVSSDLPELLALADRVLVVRDGRVVGELNRDEATETNVMSLAVGREAEVGSDE